MKRASQMPALRPAVVGNWKMYKTAAEAVSDAAELARRVSDVKGLDLWVAPSFTALRSVGEALRGTGIGLAAQDLHWEAEGAFTGEVSPRQLVDAGCTAVIIGHSERRQHFNETNETVALKIRAALSHGLAGIVCVGETLDQRKRGETAGLLAFQIESALKGSDPEKAADLMIAYEPVWAIGTGQVAGSAPIAEAHRLIREKLSGIFGKKADAIRILYGGSVTPDNIQELAGIGELEGVLVGGASRSVDSMSRIIRALYEARVKTRIKKG